MGLEVEEPVRAPDEREAIARAIREAARASRLVVTTGGTGFGPRDVTPEATRDVLEREAPGVAELLRAHGLRSTPLAALSRGLAGTVGGCLVVKSAGEPEGGRGRARALRPLLPHVLDLLAGGPSTG